MRSWDRKWKKCLYLLYLRSTVPVTPSSCGWVTPICDEIKSDHCFVKHLFSGFVGGVKECKSTGAASTTAQISNNDEIKMSLWLKRFTPVPQDWVSVTEPNTHWGASIGFNKCSEWVSFPIEHLSSLECCPLMVHYCHLVVYQKLIGKLSCQSQINQADISSNANTLFILIAPPLQRCELCRETLMLFCIKET